MKRMSVGREFPDPRHLHNQDIYRRLESKWLFSDHSYFDELIPNIKRWDLVMARKAYRIELKIDFNDDELHEHMLAVAKQYARDLIASAMLLSDGRKPDIALITDDSFVGREDIELLEPSENVHTDLAE